MSDIGIRVTKVALDTIGCKLNQAETEILARQLLEAGYRLVSAADKADIYVLNTCTVTQIADSKSRHLLRLAHRQNPEARLVVTGCYAQRAPQELAQIEGVDFVLGNGQKPNLLRLLEDSGYPSRANSAQAATNRRDSILRTRAFVKVQDGCRNYCAYCIVPLVRGEEKSVPVERVIAEIKQRVVEGYQEVVLTGTEIGAYSCDGVGFVGLLERVLGQTAVNRVRLSSLQPQEVSSELVRLWSNERLCPHFHLSLQSGSDTVLRRMKRRYSVAEYRRAVSLIREAVPEVAITTDIIVGFPGETEEEFQESYDFCRQMEFARIHVFPFSTRAGTEAALMPQPVDDKVKKQRSRQMLALATASTLNFRKRYSGKTIPVLWEQQSHNGVWTGLTGNYIKVYTRSSENLANKLLPAKLLEVKGDGVWGELK